MSALHLRDQDIVTLLNAVEDGYELLDQKLAEAEDDSTLYLVEDVESMQRSQAAYVELAEAIGDLMDNEVTA